MMNLKSFFKIYLRKALRLPDVRKPFYDFFYYTGRRPAKRALLSYRVNGVWTQSRVAWSAIGDVHDILQALSELGYRTDIIDYADTTFVPQRHYDLFVGHTGDNYAHIVRHLSPKTVKIFYPMYAYWKFQNAEEEKRIAEVRERRGVTLHAERAIHVSDDYALEHADGVILLSNDLGRRTYPHPERISILDSASYGGGKCLDLATKNFEAARNNFLFIAGSGNVHKRLDLLLEAFTRMPGKQLYLCTKLEDDFRAAYARELFETPNIHYIGHIRLYTPQFYELMRTCNYVIHTSCSEGSPGAVIDGMFQGLIPIVSAGAHIDVDDLGYVIEPCIVETIMATAQDVSGHDASWYVERACHVQREAQRRFGEDVYIAKLKQHIQSIVRQKSYVAST